MKDNILLKDSGEAFVESKSPLDGVGTPYTYCAPDLLLENKATRWSDIWALSCTIFEIRSGFSLFDSFFGSPAKVLRDIIGFLGPLPQSWRHELKRFDIETAQEPDASECSLGERVKLMGRTGDDNEDHLTIDTNVSLSNPAARARWIEPHDTAISKAEASALAGLLQRTLTYAPRDVGQRKRLPSIDG